MALVHPVTMIRKLMTDLDRSTKSKSAFISNGYSTAISICGSFVLVFCMIYICLFPHNLLLVGIRSLDIGIGIRHKSLQCNFPADHIGFRIVVDYMGPYSNKIS